VTKYKVRNSGPEIFESKMHEVANCCIFLIIKPIRCTDFSNPAALEQQDQDYDAILIVL
jgi:hypothetical protein